MSENLENAKQLVQRISTATEPISLEDSQVVNALEALAKTDDEASFRTVVDAYVEQLKGRGEIEDPYAFVEWLCMGKDHTFTVVGHTSWDVAAGNLPQSYCLSLLEIQAFFRKLYGGHFYVKDQIGRN